MNTRAKIIQYCFPIMTCIAVTATFVVNSSAAVNPDFTIVRYALPTPGSQPSSITAGPDGNVWFTEQNAIGRITTAGAITEFAVSGASNIVAGPDGNLWFTQPSAIGRITPAGQITQLPLPNLGASPSDITANLDGNLWFCAGTNIGRMTPAGSLTIFPLPAFIDTVTGQPLLIFVTAKRIAAGANGNLWFSEGLIGSTRDFRALGTMTTAGVAQTDEVTGCFTCGTRVPDLTLGPDGNIWFSRIDFSVSIWSISSTGTATSHGGLDGGVEPERICAGPDGNLWFTRVDFPGTLPQVGRITTAGVITLFNTTNVNANALAAGPDGQLWFTDSTNNQVGKFVVAPTNCQGPTIVCPNNISLPDSPDPLVPVTFSVTAIDDCDPAPVVTTFPASGSGFPVGVTTVIATAQDFFGLQSTCSFTVTREPCPGPTIVCPTNISVPHSPDPLVPVTFTVTATDDCDPAPVVTTSIASGSGFPVGVTTVTATAQDSLGNQSTCAFTVTRPPACQPIIVCPGDISVPCNTDLLVPVTFSVTATDTCDLAPVVTTSIASGSGFSVGVTTVTATAQDSVGSQSTCSFSVTRDPLGFDGFAVPIGGADATGGSFNAPARTFKLGSVIPVKFTASCAGSAVTTGVHTLQAIKWTDQTNSEQPIDATPPGGADDGNNFRLEGDGWHYNLSTTGTGMSVGQWQLVATLSDGSQHSVWVQIK